MKISLGWIREYVDVDLERAELVDRLTMIGLVPETVEERDGDLVLDLETYANRPDTLGHLGVAREIGAMLGRPLLDKAWPVEELDEATADAADVTIEAEALCPRYCGLVVRNVAVGPSPDWLRRRLEAVGLRPINNVVDVSNYILFATAQPIHTFDLGRIGGGRIVVRRAAKCETLIDLDGRALTLSRGMLVIADESKPVALAGIIGGQASGITASTRDVFIESANFAPVTIRKTAKALGLATDASYRFERGADIGFAPRAALMAASLLTRMGGRATKGLIDRFPRPPRPRTVRLRLGRVKALLGVEVPAPFVVDLLERLGFQVEAVRKTAWKARVPTFRVDVAEEADLVEEVARFYGYDRIPAQVTPVDSFPLDVNRKRERLARIRETLAGQGFDEAVNWSFADPDKEAIAASGRAPVAIQNPISARASIMRTTLLPGLLENAARNLNRGLEGVRLFEAGGIYFRREEATCEQLSLGLLATGLVGTLHWQSRPE
ncbi:MAG TPA: phenylalanine--tRNA ligase subunit beta, partial [Candidatus Aminicenantes bacterium]|nr:phenylalanine--tRNA ligase subunit beta [Candidatus Aminicenantes bacterium]